MSVLQWERSERDTEGERERLQRRWRGRRSDRQLHRGSSLRTAGEDRLLSGAAGLKKKRKRKKRKKKKWNVLTETSESLMDC